MTTLTAPISEADYDNFPGLKTPEGFTGEKMILLLNKAWAEITTLAKQPLSVTSTTEVKEFGTRYCNVRPDGSLVILPEFLPLVSVTTLKYSLSPANFGWTSLTGFDTLSGKVVLIDSPFVRGDTGFIQLVYTSGLAVIPEDLKLVCALMAAHLLSCGYFPSQGGGGEGSLLPAWLPKDVEKIINFYKRVR